MTGLEQLDLMDVPMRRQAELAELLRMLPSLEFLGTDPFSNCLSDGGTPSKAEWLVIQAALQQQFPEVEIQ